MKRFKFYYEVKRDPEVGEEVIVARTEKEAKEFFDDMVKEGSEELAQQSACYTPNYCEIKLVRIKELDENT